MKYLQLILHCKEVDHDIKDFRIKEQNVRRKWQYEKVIDRDVSRTLFLKDNQKFHVDIKRVVEFYCQALNVAYC
jgi:hypothetical protein